MRVILDHLADTDELGFAGWGQSNRRPWGDRATEALLAAPHLALRDAGLDLTIEAIVPEAVGGGHGGIGTRSVVTVSESFVQADDWKNGELRLVQADWGESVFSTKRKGHAKVLASTTLLANTTTATLSADSANSKWRWPGHGAKSGSVIVWSTTGTLPGGMVAGKHYYVHALSPDTIAVVDGAQIGWLAALTPTGGSGVHTATILPTLTVEWQSEFQAPASVTFSAGTPGIVNQTAHGMPEGSTVSFAGTSPGDIPPELDLGGLHFYVANPTADAYEVSATLGSASLAFAAPAGPTTVTPRVMAFVSGYVHLHDRFNSYDNVLVVAPYQPIEPGDYPVGTPVVPGYTLSADVTSYADAGLVLPFTHREGVDGYGSIGEGTVLGFVFTKTSGDALDVNLYADGFLRVGGAKGRVVSNTATTATVSSWTPTAGPGAGTHPFLIHLPHWRNNPHHYTAGEGFLYPLDDMQPGGSIGSGNPSGLTYSRPRGRLVGSYVSTNQAGFQTVNAGINSATGNPSRCITNASAQMTVALGTGLDSGTLAVSWVPTTNNPATEQIQFEHFLRAGYVVLLVNMGQTPSVDGAWRIVRLEHTKGAGATIFLTPQNPNLVSLPGSVSGTVPAAAFVFRLISKPLFKFGSILEACWRLSLALGRRIIAMHLGVNSSSMFPSFTNAGYGFQGQLGWFDDDLAFSWTPADPNSLAARLKRVVDFIAPRAVATSLGATKKLKVVALDGWQLETDALFTAGRDSARESVPTFANWLRRVITAAGLSPYPSGVRIPVQWAQLTKIPWEQGFLLANPLSFPATTGDTEGKVNAALKRFVALDGFAASIDPNGAAKGGDNAHFNGFGQVTNGKAVADALIPLIRLGFSFALGPGAIAVANEALALLGEKSNVTSLEPPNNSAQAQLAARFLPASRAWTLQQHPWTFATHRVAAVAVENTVSTWAYAYAVPPDLLHPTKVLDPAATDDLQVRSSKVSDKYSRRLTQEPLEPASQPFQIEADAQGYRVLRTDQQNAMLVYIAGNVPFEAWDPAARQACIYKLASLMCGDTLKGKTGIAVSREMLQMALIEVAKAASINAEYQKDVRPEVRADWLP